jgi:hypothetical protein
MESEFFCDSILQFLGSEVVTTDSVLESEELDNLFSELPDPCPSVVEATPLVTSGDSKTTKEFQLASEKELQRLLEKKENTNTKRSTGTWIRRFKKWATKRELPTDLACIPKQAVTFTCIEKLLSKRPLELRESGRPYLAPLRKPRDWSTALRYGLQNSPSERIPSTIL